MIVNIIAFFLFLSTMGVFIYIYAVPWLKGTYVDDDSCASLGWPCKSGTYCCRDPREGSANCTSVECSSIRLEKPTDNQKHFFNVYLLAVSILLVILLLVKFIKPNW